MNFKSTYFLLLLLLSAFSCSDSKTSPQSEVARMRAVEAAELVLKYIDTTEIALQGYILNARAIQSEYILAGDSIAANDFQSAFENHIKQHNDSLAKILF